MSIAMTIMVPIITMLVMMPLVLVITFAMSTPRAMPMPTIISMPIIAIANQNTPWIIVISNISVHTAPGM
jgi:hypothetical protein